MVKQRRTKPVSQYAGELTLAEIHMGIVAAQANAARLLDDSKILLNGERFASAITLAVLSIEERGKVLILKRLCSATSPEEIKLIWREYRDHRAKNAGWIIPTLVRGGARTMHSMASAIDAEAEHAATLDALKQITTYTDISERKNWIVPAEIANAELAASIISAAEMMWLSNPVSFRELELLREHLTGHANKPSIAAAVLCFQDACYREGLTNNPPEELLAFMQGKAPFADEDPVG